MVSAVGYRVERDAGQMMKPVLAWALLLMLFSGSAIGQTRQLTGDRSNSRHPAWDPDGRFIAFESDRNGTWDIFVLELETGRVAPLVESPESNRYPAWSPDGSRLLFTSGREGVSRLFVLDIESGRRTGVATPPGSVIFPTWTPDGASASFTLRTAEESKLVSVHLRTLEAQSLVMPAGRDIWPRWAPQGRRLAFFSRRDTGGDDDEIYVWSPGSEVPTRITRKPGHDFCPAWDPSGTHLIFVSIDPDGARDLQIVDAASGDPRGNIAQGYYRVTEPSWSPDGGWIAYAAAPNEGDSYQLYVASRN